MWESLSNLSALSVFIGIASLGFLFLLISLVFGEVFDHLDFGGGLDHDFDGGPSFLSARGMAVFATAFGGFGAIGIYLGLGVFPSSLVGFAGGVVMATLVFLFARFLYGQQATTTVSSSDLVGRSAQVSVAIPSDGVGQIRCLIGESVIDKIARSRDGSSIQSNSLVKIEEVIGEAVIVSPLAAPQPDANKG